MSSVDPVNLDQFLKHTPRVLRRQLIFQLVELYTGVGKTTTTVPVKGASAYSCKPSIQRFHCALLFVDISGFTVLSQRLSVEELKIRINEYFTKMLDIVDKHGGDVIKFAGDALFIIWQTDQVTALSEETSHVHYDVARQRALKKAVDCGKEINAACGNHKIIIPGTGGTTVSRALSTMFGGVKDKNPVLSPIDSSGTSTPSTEEAVAYLNVHSGVSMGLMAGIDIGSDNRWEYFLIGEPLSKVAEAEGQASTGDMIICPESHVILHGREEPVPMLKRFGTAVASTFNLLGRSRASSTSSTDLHGGNASGGSSPHHGKPMKCGCVPLKGGYCKMDMTLPPEKKSPVKKNRAPTRNINLNPSHSANLDMVLVETMKTDIEDAFKTFQPLFGDKIEKCARARGARSSRNTQVEGHNMPAPGVEGERTPAEVVLENFKTFALVCLQDEMARHVHAAVRHEYVFEAHKLAKQLLDDAEALKLEVPNTPKSVAQDSPTYLHHNGSVSHGGTLSISNSGGSGGSFLHPHLSAHSSAAHLSVHSSTHSQSSGHLSPTPGGGLNASGSMNAARLSGLHRGESHYHGGSIVHTGGALVGGKPREAPAMTAELRQVTVMFVKIDLSDMQLMIDSTKRMTIGGGYRFMSKTVNEKFADLMILDRMQSCIEALSTSFTSHGGQMRQFIVDDKGTVCIGTFGLRGSMSDDNAASALNTAHAIVTKLKAINLNCSIGVTVGRAYCGLVGSDKRHEYAVMGPSTNLSARLMCKAPPGGVICDVETRHRDRTHQFVTLADIVAKGYKDPVGTFKPIFESEVNAITPNRHGSEGNLTELDLVAKASLDGADAESVQSLKAETNEVILKILKSKFFIEVNVGNKTAKQELYGRRQHMKQAVGFAFSGLTLEAAAISEKTPPPGGERRAPQLVFNHLLPTRFVGIVGAQGIGKTSFVLTMTQRVFAVTSANPETYNIQLFKSRLSFAGCGAFTAWKPIISEMLIRIFRIAQPAVQQAHATRKRSMIAGVSTGSSDVATGIDYAVQYFPKTLQRYKPLFGHFGIVDEDVAAVGALQLTDQERIMHGTQLLLSVIHLYLKATSNLVFITMEDIHLFDQHSLAVLYEVYNYHGIVVLFTGRLQSATVHMNITDSSNLQSFTCLLDEPKKYLEIQLDALSLAATTSLVKDIFTLNKLGQVDETVYSTVFEASRGNPFYTYEIARSMAESKDVNVTVVKAAHCIRVEEVICYRLDQLKGSAQSMLKIAAVAFSNGTSVSLDLLAGLTFDDKPITPSHTMARIVSPAINLRNCATLLLEIIQSESFIHVVPAVRLDNKPHVEVDISTITVDTMLAGEFLFEFSISLEQSTIYGLLLDDQKQVIHEKIAMYFANLREEGVPTNQHSYAEEGFHWHRANIPGNAMLCCYRAAEGDCGDAKATELISTAYAMYSLLRDANGGGQVAARRMELRLNDVKNAFETSFGNVCLMPGAASPLSPTAAAAKAAMSPTSAQVPTLMTLEYAHEVFGGKSELLAAGVLTHIRKAQQAVAAMEDPTLTNLLLEDALQLVLLGKNPVLMDASYMSAIMDTMGGGNESRGFPMNFNLLKDSGSNDYQDNIGGGRGGNNIHFVLEEFFDMFFPVVSAYLQNYLLMVTIIGDCDAKVQFVVERSLEAVRAERPNSLHHVQMLIQAVLVQCHAGCHNKALALFDELRGLYAYDQHAAGLIAAYGSDQMAQCCGVMAQHFILSREEEKAHATTQLASDILTRLLHTQSLAASLLAGLSALVFAHRCSDALTILVKFDSLMKQQQALAGHEQAPYPRMKLVDLLHEWLLSKQKATLLRQPSGGSSSGLIRQGSGGSGVVEVVPHGEFDLLVEKREVITPPDTAPLGFGHLSRYGLGVKGVLADLCVQRYVQMTHSKVSAKLMVYLEGACSYAAAMLTTTTLSTHTHELMAGKLRALQTLTELVESLLEGGQTKEGPSAQMVKKALSEQLIKTVRDEAGRNQAAAVLEALDRLVGLLY